MSSIILDLILLLSVFALTAFAALFVAAEYALTTLERHQLTAHVATIGDATAHRLDKAHRTLSFQLSGAQLGITLTTLATGYMARPAVAGLLSPLFSAIGLPRTVNDPLATVLALVATTTLSVIFGELVPKQLAIAKPLEVGRFTVGIQSRFALVFSWLIHLLNGSANWIVRRMGIEPAEELRAARSAAELGALVRSSAAQGAMDVHTATVLDRSFKLGERTAEELMTPRVQIHAIDQAATVAELISQALATGRSRFPVYDGDVDNVVGAVHIKQAFGLDHATPVRDIAVEVPKVPTTLNADALLTQLRTSELQLAIVVDEWGGTAGLVTLEDVVEEIIGDVRDEHDGSEASPIRTLGLAGWLVSGLLRADELKEATGFLMPEGDYETLAGFVVSQLGRIPEPGTHLEHEDWTLTVVRMDRHRIAEIRLTRPEASTR
jgi:CBS domain containing-hemolysin-like protein